MQPSRRLTRSTTQRLLGGVCGGLASYWQVNPLFVRLGFVLLVLYGVSPLVYVVLWAVLPTDQSAAQGFSQQLRENLTDMRQRGTVVAQWVRAQIQPLRTQRQLTPPPAPTQANSAASEPTTSPNTGPTTRL